MSAHTPTDDEVEVAAREIGKMKTRPANGSCRRFIDEAIAYQGDDCILWPYRIDTGGYASITINGVTLKANRVVCEAVHGPAPTKHHQAAHECGVKTCVNGRHLSWKTPTENARDKKRHGTEAKGERHGFAKLTDEAVRIMRVAIPLGLWNTEDAAKTFGCTVGVIRDAVAGRSWRHIDEDLRAVAEHRAKAAPPMTATNITDEQVEIATKDEPVRQAFERWLQRSGDVRDGQYWVKITDVCWPAWRAARRAAFEEAAVWFEQSQRWPDFGAVIAADIRNLAAIDASPNRRRKPMSIISQAKDELRRINFGDEDSAAMIEILERFFAQWDSGGAVYAVAPILQRLIAGKPLSPLTGEDDEWFDHGDGVLQNKRISSVFKDPRFHDGKLAYDLDNPGGRRAAISFPYWPERAEVSSPVVEIDTSSSGESK